MSSPEKVALAVDLGTTTIAASLVDIATGLRLASCGCMNPQREFGADVITRLSVADDSPDLRHRMARLVNAELERLAMLLLEEVGMPPDCLGRVAIAGNPAMEHLLLDLPVASLARIPYRPLFSEGKRVNTADLGWKLHLHAYIFPLPGGFVGGDLVAFLYGRMISDFRLTTHDSRLYLDLGTNAEIALVSGDRIFATSAAAGPAFEAGNLTCGMPAVPGAVTDVALDGERMRLTVIGGGSPSGLCGTGALSLLSVLLSERVMGSDGRLREKDEIESNMANRITDISGETAFTVHRDAGKTVVLTQGDIRQIQLAKGALRAGIEVLMERSGISYEDVGELVVTGSFGSAINPGHIESLGIIPFGMSAKPVFCSEGALAGVEKFLFRPEGERELNSLLEDFRIVPLSGNPVFEARFMEHMEFREWK